MAQETIHDDGSGAVLTVEVSIVNETSRVVEILRVHPTRFEEQAMLVLNREIKKTTAGVADWVIAKAATK